jgi:hypothetical protein
MTKNDEAAERLRLMCQRAGHVRRRRDGQLAIRFDPRRGDYDPTPDLDALGVSYRVFVCRNPAKNRAWFEARFRPSDFAMT